MQVVQAVQAALRGACPGRHRRAAWEAAGVTEPEREQSPEQGWAWEPWERAVRKALEPEFARLAQADLRDEQR